MAQQNLGVEVKESLADGSTRMDLGINAIVRKLMGGKDSLSLDMDIPLLNGTEEGLNARLAITNLKLAGLDSFGKFNMIQPLSKWTVGYGFDLGKLDGSVQMQLSMVDPK